MSKLLCSTFNGIQGGEADINIIDLTVESAIGFLSDKARLTVGASRGKNDLIVIANVAQIEGWLFFNIMDHNVESAIGLLFDKARLTVGALKGRMA